MTNTARNLIAASQRLVVCENSSLRFLKYKMPAYSNPRAMQKITNQAGYSVIKLKSTSSKVQLWELKITCAYHRQR